MIRTLLNIICLTLLLGGCTAHYGPKGINGGYSDKQIDHTTYFIRYDGATLAGAFTDSNSLVTLWNKRAKELCGGEDFYQEIKNIRVDVYGNESLIGNPATYGVAYCNTKIIDTRKQNPDENFLPYINLPYEAFEYKEISPLWGLLIDKKYLELQQEIDALLLELNDEDISGFLNTFSRINPAAEEYLTEWVNSNPNSFAALYSRAVFYHHYSWFKRGDRVWKDVTKEQRDGLKKYQDLSIIDLNRAMDLNPKFCPSHNLKLNIYTAIKKEYASFDQFYNTAKQLCPDSIAIRQAYLRYLLPRWAGSTEKMRRFIESSKNDNESFASLEALYLAEEGDQYLYKNQYDQALKKYTIALEKGSFSQIYGNRAIAFEQLGRYVEAVQDFETSIILSPYNDSAYSGLIRVLLKQNNPVGALVASSYLTTMNNQSPEYFEAKGNIFYLMRRYEDALVSYKKSAILSSNKAYYLHKIKMAEFQINIRKNEQASEDKGEII